VRRNGTVEYETTGPAEKVIIDWEIVSNAPAHIRGPDDEYPLVLTTGRLLEHWHTGAMTRRAGVLDAIEPVGIAAMNPRDMQKRGLRQGDRITVETRRGMLEAILRADREVAEGSVFMPFCFAESPANRLTNPKLDPFGKIPEFKYCAARVEPAQQDVREAALAATD
jgi:formate dehydrogenase major subunit